MSCEHYWREAILRAERGEPDPHRDTCVDCRREHKARAELVHALSLVGAAFAGDSTWEVRVWSRIARLERRGPRRRWLLGGFATAFAAAVTCSVIGHRDRSHEERPRIEVVHGEVAMRSASPSVGDRIRIAVNPTDEVRIYRAADLVLRCPASSAADGCVPDANGMVAEAPIAAPGEYQVVVITSATAEPVGRIERDLAAIVAAGGDYQITELSVR